ncbi:MULTISPECIES: DUF4153 domain-containing protein [Tsukamurella]|uniref:DUF4173 domain-containing protein n=2 Tax=Tsukamurella TaxID=2060 RepID=A0A5C5RYS0_9ACTN|nr:MULTISPECIES: DUF4173 domain-containing protein [Tsukamurella]NMD54231.1 DUF4173 domain-containing protein [Tsukamurella columbiensis]TWS28247.1 DUF4173 domain-containing protein [Tsukamurella conjunctivitidis]
MTLPPLPSATPGGWSPGPNPPAPAVQAPIPPPRPGEPARLYGPALPPVAGTDLLFGAYWRDDEVPARPLLLGAAVVVGVISAALLPDHAFASVGGLIVVAAVLLAPLCFAKNRRSPFTWVAGALAAGLAALLVLRAAGWLSALVVIALIPLVFSALAGARTVRDIAASAALWPLSLVRSAPWARRTVGTVRRLPIGWPVLRTAALCLAALVVFGALFATGDAVFGSWVQALLPRFDGGGLLWRAVLAAFVAVLTLGVGYTAINPPGPVVGTSLFADRRALHRYEWLAPLGVVIAMFAGFVAAQATTLWAGHEYVQRTAGVTYAESVHRGFGQLTVATLLALLVVGLTWWAAPRETRSDRLALSVSLGILCALALVVVVSALYRMHVYQQAYGFTVLRLVVDAFELWMGALLVLAAVAVAFRAVALLPRAALCSAALVLFGLGLMNPEAWVAEHNVARFEESGKVDLDYLATLGPDARPAIARLPADLARCAVAPTSNEGGSWLDWNLGKQRADAVALESKRGADECGVDEARR